MAKVSNVNVNCATNGGAEAIWTLVNLLISNGWTKFADSDGTTYSSSGTQVTGSGSGANGLNNANAWVALRDPSGASGRKYLFQRGTNNYDWWIRYVRSATLNTSGNATTMPTNPSVANDLQNIHGTSASGTTLFRTTTDYYAHAVFETTAAFGVYQFYIATTQKVTGTPLGGMIVIGTDTTTVSNNLDQDPAVCKAGSSVNSTVTWFNFSSAMLMWQYYGMVSPAPSWVTGGSSLIFTSTAVATVNQYTGNDDSVPVLFTSAASNQPPYKGQSTWARIALVRRDYPNTTNLNTDAYCYFSLPGNVIYVLLPWPNGTTPQL